MSHLPVSIIREELERFLRGPDSMITLVIDNFETVTAPDFDLDVAALAELNEHLYSVVISRRLAALACDRV